jgi:hypothetical protein
VLAAASGLAYTVLHGGDAALGLAEELL